MENEDNFGKKINVKKRNGTIKVNLPNKERKIVKRIGGSTTIQRHFKSMYSKQHLKNIKSTSIIIKISERCPIHYYQKQLTIYVVFQWTLKVQLFNKHPC